MTADFSHIVTPIEKYYIDDILQLNQAMPDNPQAVIGYIMSLRDDRHKLNETKKKETRIRERSRALKEQNKKHDRKRRVVESFPGISDILFGPSICFVMMFSAIQYEILPWSPKFQLIAKDRLFAM
jgi:hypothetical protein